MKRKVQTEANVLSDKDHKTPAVRFDISDDAKVGTMVKQTVATFGRLDAAYNNASVQGILARWRTLRRGLRPGNGDLPGFV